MVLSFRPTQSEGKLLLLKENFLHQYYFQIEGKLRTIANPLVTTRLENIVEGMPKVPDDEEFIVVTEKTGIEKNSEDDKKILEDDEVSIIFYGKNWIKLISDWYSELKISSMFSNAVGPPRIDRL